MSKLTRDDIAAMANRASDAGQAELAEDLHAILGRINRTFGGTDGYDVHEDRTFAIALGINRARRNRVEGLGSTA